MRIIEKIRQKKQIVRAVIYARFSSDNQREESIDAQVRAIQDYAKKCLGAYAGSRKHAGRNKKLQVTYRCITRKSKHACTNKEIRREYFDESNLR